jgi:hypothetical protein
MPATASLVEATAGTRALDPLPLHAPEPTAAVGRQPMSAGLAPTDAVALLMEPSNREGAVEQRRAILGRIQHTYGNRYAGMVVAELRAREAEKTGKPPPEPLEPERTQPSRAGLTSPNVAGIPSAAPAALTPALAAMTTVAPAKATATPAQAAPSAPPASAAAAPPVAARKDEAEPVSAPRPLAEQISRVEPSEALTKLATVQKAGGNLASQRGVETAVAEPAITIEKAPASPQEDPGYQAVVKQLRTIAKHERTPPKKPEEKSHEVKEAAELPPATLEKKSGYENHLQMMESVPPPKAEDFTVAAFTEKFRAKIDQIASNLPKQKDDQGSVSRAAAFATEKIATVQEVRTQNQNLSARLRKEADKNPSDLKDKVTTKAPTLKVDPAGNTPELKTTRAAIPKPRTNQEISMDSESRALDDSLKNHNVAGQTVNIDEGSLAYPVSGETGFDEAGEAKRKAQEQIRKLVPSYRAEERGVIAKSDAEISNTVKAGLNEQHKIRSGKFGDVLGKQKHHESNITGAKEVVFAKFQNIYKEAKRQVDEELAKISNIETEFEAVLNKADEKFKAWVHQDLEYIYTPGFFDYSDWKDKNAEEIKEEYRRLKEQNGSENKIIGGFDYQYFQAMDNVRDRHAKTLFERAKNSFIWDVMYGLEQIAGKVVQVLNTAVKYIRDAKKETKKIYDGLDTEQQKELATALDAVVGQYESLEETVKDREREIIEDMARNYSRSVGKLQATFDEIKKDVLTSWLEKAWNKLKAVVNAIIDFAIRIAELLGRVVHLLGDIISSPRAFFRNLITGIGEGFSTFVNRIDEFLATAFFDWIRGTSGVQVQLPKEWNPAGIFSLFTQLLNLSTETIWQRMEVVYDKSVANAFRRGEVVLHKGLEIFDIIKTKGLGGLWDHIRESLGTLLSDTLDTIKETVLYAAIKKVIIEIGKMLVPGGGFIAIAEKIIRLLVFIVEARNKILDLIESFVTSMENAVKGDITGIVKLITTALTRFITVALDFLVSFFGLSSLKEKVERFIERMRNPVIRGIDFVLQKFKPLVMKGAEVFVKGKETVIAAGKAVVQVGLPEDPKERLKLGMQAAVKVVDALSGRSITQRVIAPALAGVRIRYGFTTLTPVVRDGIWWVEGTINPTLVVPTHQPASTQSADQQQLESLVGRIPVTYPIDGLGRPSGPSGYVVGIKVGDREAMTSKFMRGYQPGDHRGHLIGDRFHGPSVPANLVPMHPTLNLSTYKSQENTIASRALALAGNNRPVLILMNAKPTYPLDDATDDASFRPTYVTISARISTLRLGENVPTVEHEEISSPPLANPPAEVTSVAINGDLEEMKAALRVLIAPRLQNSRNVRRLVEAVVSARRDGPFGRHDMFRLRTSHVLGHDYVYLLESVRDSEITL